MSFDLIKKIEAGGTDCLCSANDIYVLSEAIVMVQDELMGDECKSNAISILNTKYCLSDLKFVDGSGIGFFRIDNNEDCSVFKIYR